MPGMWHILGKEYIQGFGGGCLKERDHLADLGIGGRKILELMLKIKW